MLVPKLFTVLRQGYSFRQFRQDIMAGIVVGIVALPLAIAFAIASGVTPDKGLITAVVAGFLISALGGSRVQIGGPTGAFVVIVYSIVQKFGIDGLIVATFMAGVFLIIFGFARFGGVIKFIPLPVTVGFTSGIAVIIFSSQINDFLGLQIRGLPAEFVDKWICYFQNISMLNPYAVGIALLTMGIIIFCQKKIPKIPGAIIAMVSATVLVHIFKFPVETITSRFGPISHAFPVPGLPRVSLSMIRELVSPAMTIALLAGVESLLSAVVADGMIGGKHRSNMELIAQGIANIGSAFFGGMPATGAIARTAVNVQNGARTPVAGITHAVTLLLIIVIFGKWAGLIPMPSLAGILIVVAYRMAEWNAFRTILKAPKSDVAVLLVTFLLTVFIDLTVAIQMGIVLAAMLLMHRLSLTANIKSITNEFKDDEDPQDEAFALEKEKVPQGVEIFEIQGPFFFGMISVFTEAVMRTERKPKVKIIRMRRVLSIDATAINALRQAYLFCKKNQIAFILSGVHAQPLIALERCGLLKEIGEDRIFKPIDDALACARAIVEKPLL